MFKRTVLLTLVILGLLPACHPDNAVQARQVVSHYCDARYKGYRPLNFDKPQPYYVPYQSSSVYISISEHKKLLQRQQQTLQEFVAPRNKTLYRVKTDSITRVIDTIDRALAQNRLTYRPERRGWVITHWYSQQNDNGATVRSSTRFVIDDDFKHVLQTL